MYGGQNMKKLSLLIFALYTANVFAHGTCSSPNIYTQNGYRYIVSNGMPCNPGRFPNRHNPNAISTQNYTFRVPLNPQFTGRSIPGGMNDFGVALDGIPFDPGTAEYYNNNRSSGWNYAAMTGFTNLGLDDNHAHVQPNGAYHYHGAPTSLISQLQHGAAKMTLIGYAADGFPIYFKYAHQQADNMNSPIKEMKSSYRLKSGTRPNPPGGKYNGAFVQDFEHVQDSGDLDDCNGRRVVSKEYPQGIYSYFITTDFPYVPRCFKGTPDPSFQKRRPQHGRGREERGQSSEGGRRPPPPRRPF